ncbi:hypothetical protein CEUSTIGMA_g2211.t1 [Chlamydomonas eustigma]|uniref:Molybdate-anion transporter n=1 Tax=Chlamydomonas eustigma TaxID=1157962 RepID=A0A250WV92_9CHLO|nr:hypothetical protein CEUSTIGMA_g2211.t1 [Chlamydomonas eustigma]|eukprot:GAX74764.1 hypothetical protein CEUSTIGMA_g2211.t1 [Chlamydomonas eustigma]
MDAFYLIVFLSLACFALIFEVRQQVHFQSRDDEASVGRPSNQFKAFRTNYLWVYSLMMAGDWLQGPYIYALYEHYGYQVKDIGRLFIFGFGSSMVFGTVVGAMADKYGRRNACLLYVVTYSLSCLTKHFRQYWILLMGRLLGGVSTSLLFSTFESWLVAEHQSQGFSPALLSDIFSKSVFLGGGLMAILSGLLGDFLVAGLCLGATAPFDAAILVMMTGGLIVASTWSENYGGESTGSLTEQFLGGLKAIGEDRKVMLLGAMQALFEASMYTFVFLWTPALSPHGEKIPHGIVFACFMTACMAGSALAGLLMQRYRIENFMVAVFVLSAASMAVPLFFHLRVRDNDAGSSLGESGMGGIDTSGKMQLMSFCLFEGCVGMFWPAMMSMRARFVPEEYRSTVINIFRMPLNFLVCLMLFKVSSFPLSVIFGFCLVFLLVCALCQLSLNYLVSMAEVGGATYSNGIASSLPALNGLRHASSPIISSTKQSEVVLTSPEGQLVPSNTVQVVPGVIGHRVGHVGRTTRSSTSFH